MKYSVVKYYQIDSLVNVKDYPTWLQSAINRDHIIITENKKDILGYIRKREGNITIMDKDYILLDTHDCYYTCKPKDFKLNQV